MSLYSDAISAAPGTSIYRELRARALQGDRGAAESLVYAAVWHKMDTKRGSLRRRRLRMFQKLCRLRPIKVSLEEAGGGRS